MSQASLGPKNSSAIPIEHSNSRRSVLEIAAFPDVDVRVPVLAGDHVRVPVSAGDHVRVPVSACDHVRVPVLAGDEALNDESKQQKHKTRIMHKVNK